MFFSKNGEIFAHVFFVFFERGFGCGNEQIGDLAHGGGYDYRVVLESFRYKGGGAMDAFCGPQRGAAEFENDGVHRVGNKKALRGGLGRVRFFGTRHLSPVTALLSLFLVLYELCVHDGVSIGWRFLNCQFVVFSIRILASLCRQVLLVRIPNPPLV